jgi:hypothetical protein
MLNVFKICEMYLKYVTCNKTRNYVLYVCNICIKNVCMTERQEIIRIVNIFCLAVRKEKNTLTSLGATQTRV